MRLLLASVIVLFSFEAVAQEGAEKTTLEANTPLGENERALPGFIRLALPVSAARPWVVAAGAGYAFVEPVGDLSQVTHRLTSRVALAYSPLPQLNLGMDINGQVDFFGDANEGSNLYGEPRISARFVYPLTPQFSIGAEADLRLLGAEAPSIELEALSPSLRLLAGGPWGARTWWAAHGGFHLDRSEALVPQVDLLSTGDIISLGASSWSAIQWGLGGSHRLTEATELLAELGGEILVGSGAPRFAKSPWQFSVGARQQLNDHFSLGGSVDLGLSARSKPLPETELIAINPRVGAMVRLTWRIGAYSQKTSQSDSNTGKDLNDSSTSKTGETKKSVVAPLAVVLKTPPTRGSIVDEGGRPLADVLIVVKQRGQDDKEERSFADGHFEFLDIPEGEIEIVAKTSGFEDATIHFKKGQERQGEMVMYPAVPAGQVKGSVRDLRGKGISAKISISPGNLTIAVEPNGEFELELAPGRYTIQFEHPDFARQRRIVRVQNRGVVILNIALTP